jgi:tetrahydromethanopterin S-methyltransferase subunit B
MLGALAIPPRLVLRALDDLHTLAESVKVLPRTEDELSANIAALRDDIMALHAWLQPLHQELTDLDQTAEALEQSMDRLQAMLKKLPGI